MHTNSICVLSLLGPHYLALGCYNSPLSVLLALIPSSL